MNKIYTSMTELIGMTPIVRLSRLEERLGVGAQLYAKLEFFNPTGSIKDRAALSMILAAERDGLISEGSLLIEPTSGNTGIGIAAIAAARGYRAAIVMPDTMTKERVKLMRAYGAEVILSPGAEGMAGAVRVARELHEKTEGSYILSQFDNPANKNAHLESTAPEIFRAMGENIDIFVAGVGTGGTLSGVAEGLVENCPDLYVVAVEPESSPLLSKGHAGAHGIAGIGANFVPEILNREVIDEIVTVSDEDAMRLVRECGAAEGLGIGISSGAALAAAVKVARRIENEDKRIVVILPDGIDRYLSVEGLI
jgi:cysteine synthase A